MASQSFESLIGAMKDNLQQKALNRVLQTSLQQFSNLTEISLSPNLSSPLLNRVVWESIEHNHEKISLWSDNNRVVGITLGVGQDIEISNSIQGNIVFGSIRSVFENLQIYIVDERNNIYHYIGNPKTRTLEALYFNDKIPLLQPKSERIQYLQPCPIYYEDIFFFWVVFETRIMLLGHKANETFPVLLIYSIPNVCKRLLNIESIETRISSDHIVALHYHGNDKKVHVILLDNNIAVQYAEKVFNKELHELIKTALVPPMISGSIISKHSTKDTSLVYSMIHTSHYDYCGSHIDVSVDTFKDALQKVTVSVEVLVMLEDATINHIAYQTTEFLIRNYFVSHKDNLKVFFLHYNKPTSFLPHIVSPHTITLGYSPYNEFLGSQTETTGYNVQDCVPLWLLCAKHHLSFPTRRVVLQELWEDVQVFYDQKVSKQGVANVGLSTEEKRGIPIFSTPLRPRLSAAARHGNTPQTSDRSGPSSSNDPFKSRHEEPWLIRVILMEAMIGLGLTSELTDYLTTSYHALESYQLYELQALFQWIAGEKIIANRNTFVEGVSENAVYTIESLKRQSEVVITKFLEFHMIPTLLATKTIAVPDTVFTQPSVAGAAAVQQPPTPNMKIKRNNKKDHHHHHETSTAPIPSPTKPQKGPASATAATAEETATTNTVSLLTSVPKCAAKLRNNVYFQMIASLFPTMNALLSLLQQLKYLAHRQLTTTNTSSMVEEERLEDNIISESLMALVLQAYQASWMEKLLSLWQELYLCPTFHGLVYVPQDTQIMSLYTIEKRLDTIEKSGVGYASHGKLRTLHVHEEETHYTKEDKHLFIPFVSLLDYPSTSYTTRREEGDRVPHPSYVQKGLIYHQLIRTTYEDHHTTATAIQHTTIEASRESTESAAGMSTAILPPLCQAIAGNIFSLCSASDTTSTNSLLHSSYPINGTTSAASSVANWISSMFQLPITMMKYTIDEILCKKLYLHRTVNEMLQWIQLRMDTVIQLYLYFLDTAYDYHLHHVDDLQHHQWRSRTRSQQPLTAVSSMRQSQISQEKSLTVTQETTSFHALLAEKLSLSSTAVAYSHALRVIDQYPNYRVRDTQSTGGWVGEQERTTNMISSVEMMHPYAYSYPEDEKHLQHAVRFLTTFSGTGSGGSGGSGTDWSGCGADKKEMKKEMYFLTDHRLMSTVIGRLLVNEQYEATQAMLLSYGMIAHPLLQTSFGAMAFAVAIPDPRRWKDTWQYARLCCEKMDSPAIALETLMDITTFYCHWTIQQRQFSHFLDEFLTLPEIEAIIQFLTIKAKKDITDARSPSPAVDTLVGFLLKHHRLEEAVEIHVQHKHSIANVLHANRSEDSLVTIREREKLLNCYQQHVKHVPSVDVQLVSNLYRGFHHIQSD